MGTMGRHGYLAALLRSPPVSPFTPDPINRKYPRDVVPWVFMGRHGFLAVSLSSPPVLPLTPDPMYKYVLLRHTIGVHAQVAFRQQVVQLRRTSG